MSSLFYAFPDLTSTCCPCPFLHCVFVAKNGKNLTFYYIITLRTTTPTVFFCKYSSFTAVQTISFASYVISCYDEIVTSLFAYATYFASLYCLTGFHNFPLLFLRSLHICSLTYYRRLNSFRATASFLISSCLSFPCRWLSRV